MGITTYDSRKLPDAWQPERRASAPTTHGVPGTAASWGVQTAPMPAVSPMHVQAKLRINQPGDRFEQEADRVADAVVAGRPASLGVQAASGNAGAGNAGAGNAVTGGSVQRKCAECDKEEEERVVQRMAVSTAAPSASSAAATSGLGGGSPLPGATRARMEAVIGADFSGVRVHAGPEAASRASALNARAFTAGRDVVFGAGEYRPGTSSGDRLLAHELTHVVQQSRGLVDGVQREAVVDADVRVKPQDEGAWKSAFAVLGQVHADEHESLDAGLGFAGNRQVVIVYIERRSKGDAGIRCIRVIDSTTKKSLMLVDPNRMFPSSPSTDGNTTESGSDKREKPNGKETKEDADWVSDRASESCGGAKNVNWEQHGDVRDAVLAFRKQFIDAVEKARRVIAEHRNMRVLDVPLFFMHNNDNNGSTTTEGFAGVSAATYRPQRRIMKPGGKRANTTTYVPAIDTDDFVFLTSVEDYRAFTGNVVLDQLKTLVGDRQPYAAELDALRISPENQSSTLEDLQSFHDKVLGDSTIDAAARERVRQETQRAMVVARRFNVVLQKESRVSDIDPDRPAEPLSTSGLKRDGSASVFFRDSRYFNLETESKKGSSSSPALLLRYQAAAERLLRYLDPDMR